MTIVKAIQNLAKYLSEKFTEDNDTLQYKSTTKPYDYKTAIPSIYCFTVPSSALVDTYPAKCPCVCITLDGRDDYHYDITLHLCIGSPSKCEKEITTPIEVEGIKMPIYELGEGDDYTTEADDDLLIESILFTDQVARYMANYTAIDHSETRVMYPEVDLPDFPYAVSEISFRMSVNIDHIGSRPFDEYY